MPFIIVIILLLNAWITRPTPAAKIPLPSGDTIVAPDAQLQRLFTRAIDLKGGLTEGPAVAPDGSIYFTDILPKADKGMIMRFDPRTGKTSVFSADSGKANGLIFDSAGDLVGAQGADYGLRRVARWNIKDGRQTVVADRFKGKRFNAPNDVCIDDRGRIYFSDPRYLGHELLELVHRSVYLIDNDGKVVEITRQVSNPNGLALNSDGDVLYVADHDNDSEEKDEKIMRIYAFSLDANGLVVGSGKIMLDFGEDAGSDGMTVDESGNLYLTIRALRQPGVLVVTPKGEKIAFIPTGPPGQTESDPAVGLPSNVEFGKGAEAHMLYITVDTSLYRIPLKVKGYHRQYR